MRLTLSQPLEVSPGQIVQVSVDDNIVGSEIAASDDELMPWREAAKQRLLDAYADEDSVYDSL